MFCDQTILRLTAGNGGNGCISFRREKFVDKGGPNGGNGGKGGNIIIQVNTALNTLRHLDTYKQFTADKGEHGMGQNKNGANAEDLILEVPQGTIVREVFRDEEDNIIEKKEIADLSGSKSMLLTAKGGRGGYGNAHFVSSVRQAPKFAELGEDGEYIEVELELKLVADIGIIGIPSAGKSTLISVISNAKPKIADYPFTTLIPNLGVVQIAEKVTYIVADIPGLIEGAHEGKGLGIQFLKHVQRCRLLVHLIDPTQEPTLENFQIINRELEKFSPELAQKKQIIVFNKVDQYDQELAEEFKKELIDSLENPERFIIYPTAISAATTEGIQELKTFLWKELQQLPQLSQDAENGEDIQEPMIYRPHLDDPKYFSVEQQDDGSFLVTGQRISQIVNMTNFDNREAIHRVYDVLKKMGIAKELKKMGVQDGDTVYIGKHELEYNEDSYQ